MDSVYEKDATVGKPVLEYVTQECSSIRDWAEPYAGDRATNHFCGVNLACLGLAQSRLSQVAEAAETLRRALSLMLESDQKYHHPRVFLAFAEHCIRNARFDEAEQMISRTDRTLDDCGMLLYKINVHILRAELQINLRRPAEASSSIGFARELEEKGFHRFSRWIDLIASSPDRNG